MFRKHGSGSRAGGAAGARRAPCRQPWQGTDPGPSPPPLPVPSRRVAPGTAGAGTALPLPPPSGREHQAVRHTPAARTPPAGPSACLPSGSGPALGRGTGRRQRVNRGTGLLPSSLGDGPFGPDDFFLCFLFCFKLEALPSALNPWLLEGTGAGQHSHGASPSRCGHGVWAQTTPPLPPTGAAGQLPATSVPAAPLSLLPGPEAARAKARAEGGGRGGRRGSFSQLPSRGGARRGRGAWRWQAALPLPWRPGCSSPAPLGREEGGGPERGGGRAARGPLPPSLARSAM